MTILAITPGEPAGIGPDIVVTLAQQERSSPWLVVADPVMLSQRAEQLGLSININTDIENPSRTAGALTVYPVSVAEPVEPGKLNVANASYVVGTLKTAVSLCLEGTADAMVTAPVHKAIINQSGIAFSGHTELLAELTNTKRVVMMLATESLRVALVTTHLPLKDVAAAITSTSVSETIRILHADLQSKFGIANPRILVAGLNPHAGEDGHLGMEEINTISPVLKQLRGEGMLLEGPLPADTLFTPKYLDSADAVLAMYHDQGLPVLKYQGFGNALNVTLGLPIIRTSVDHGTALDLAGTGKANIGSMAYAISVATRCAESKVKA